MSAFDTPQEHIDWAKTRISSAEKSFLTYVQKDAFTNMVEFNPKAGEEVIKVKLAKPVPVDVAGLLRNALVDLKHSFDQSLFAAAQSSSCPRFKQTYPWADTPAGVKGIITRRQRKPESTLPQFLIDEIFRQEPHGTGPGFPGGDDLIRNLARLVNDKHTIGFKVTAAVHHMRYGNVSGDSVRSFGNNWDPVNQEIIIARVTAGSKFSYDDCTMAANIFFERTGDIGKVPVFEAAEAFAKRAQFVLDGFKAVCAL